MSDVVFPWKFKIDGKFELHGTKNEETLLIRISSIKTMLYSNFVFYK